MASATITDIEGLPAVLTMRHVQDILGNGPDKNQAAIAPYVLSSS